MALKLDNRPGNAYDPDSDGRVPGGPNDGSISDDEKEKFDEIANANPDLAALESGATTTAGNDTATNAPEAATAADIKVNINKKFSSRGKKIAGGVIVGLILSVAGAAMLLPSFLMKTITEKLTDTFMGRAKYAVQQRADKYVERYVKDVIGGTLRSCPGTKISKNCIPVKTDSKTMWGRFATNWRENRIEEKLEKNHGITFEKDLESPNEIKVFKNGELAGTYGKNSASKEAIKAAKIVDSAIDAETKGPGILTRRHIRSVLASKYGAKKWCLIACDTKDKITDKKIKGVKKLKLKIVARVSEISSARTASYMLCLTTGCSKDEIERNDKTVVDQIMKRADTQLVETLAKDIEKYGTKDLTQLVTRKVIDKLVTKVLTQQAADKSLSLIPVVGQIYLGATIAEFMSVLDDAVEDDKISKFMRNVNQAELALYAGTISTLADDTQSMQSSIEDSWSVFELFNGFGKSRVWQGINNIEEKSEIKCEDGRVLKSTDAQLTCPEQKVQQETDIEKFRDNEVVDTVMGVVNPYNACIDFFVGCAGPRDLIQPILKGISAVTGFVGETLVSGITAIPGIGSLVEKFQNFVATYAMQFFEWAAKALLPRVVNFEAEDAQAFDQTAAGNDVVGNQFAKGDPNIPEASSIGGQLLSAGQQSALDSTIYQKKREDIQGQSFFARYLDFNNTDSLASTATIDTASLFMGGKEQILSEFQPSGILSTVATLFGGQKQAYAFGSQDRADLFGNAQYGFPVDALDVDPDTLTEEQCASYKQARLDSAYVNPDTDETEYKVTDPCALDAVVTDSYTKIYSLGSENGNVGVGGTGTTGTNIADFTGPVIPCEGQPRDIVRVGADKAGWSGIAPAGSIGKNSADQDINVYIRDACAGQTNVRTVVIGASIHASENGGQVIAQELLFNKKLPPDVRIIAIPEINKAGLTGNSPYPRFNKNGVNLNRNFDYRWSEAKPGDPDSNSANWHGASAASEPETQALQNFLQNLGKTSLVISYHDNIDKVLYSGPNTAESSKIGQRYAQIVGMTNSGNQGPGFFEAWYNAKTGTPAVLVELSSDSSASYLNKHADALVKVLDENVVK